MTNSVWLRFVCVLALSLGTLACGDDSASDGDGGAGTSGGDGDGIEPISERISADDGGEIETQGASINIPPGALRADTEITIEVILRSQVPDSDNVASLVYDFGPDGTTFDEPVELRIALNTDVPSGRQARMAWLDEDSDRWMPLADSRLQGDEVIATTDHFTKFAIILSAAGQVGGSCEALEFEPCGGDIEGTWEFALGCADITAEDLFGDSNPFGDCSGLGVAIDLDISGTVTFAADGTYTNDIAREGAFTISVPTSCLPMGASCSDLADEEDMASARVVDGVCEVTTPQPAETEEASGTYELDGSELIMTEDGSSEPDDAQQYCVRGDTLTVRIVNVDEDSGSMQQIFFQATRR